MDENKWLAQQFEAHKSHLRAVAYRMLGSLSEADDAVQESWLHLSRAGTEGVENLGGWLTTVVARVCLDQLRSRKARPEEPLGARMPEEIVEREGGGNPESEVLLADSVGLALLVVLDTLAPPERLAFVLHDLFGLSFDEIAPIVGRSPTAARQLASRARRRVQGGAAKPEADIRRQREVVEAFLAAAHGGGLDALLLVLDPEVVIRVDPVALPPGAPTEVRGARIVGGNAIAFSSRSRFAQPALVNGAVGLIVAPLGQLSMALLFTIVGSKVTELELIAEPARLRLLDFAVLPA